MNNTEKKELKDLLQGLIQIKSVNPPGNENQIANFIKKFLLENNIHSELVPLEEDRSSVVAKIEGEEERNITLCGHLDTVRVKEEDWTKPVFEGLIENEKMYGIGASDMKGGVAAILYAVVLLKRRGINLKKTVQLALTADEEWGYRGAKNLVDGGYFDRTDFLIITEPSNLQVSTGEKGEVWIGAKFYGKSAHGSTPEVGVNTIIPGSELVVNVTERYGKIFEADSFWGKTSMNIGKFHGGTQVNIVPNYSEIDFDFSGYTDKEVGVLEALLKIPAGEVVSYAELGKLAGIPNAARFIGNVMAKNRFGPIVPCHRVILSDGRMGKFSGKKNHPMKIKMLTQEKAEFRL